MRHRHLRALSLLLGVTLVATSALSNPDRTALAPDLTRIVLATGIAAAATAVGVRSDNREASNRQKVLVPGGHGPGLAMAGLLFVLTWTFWSPLRAARLQPRPIRDEATLRHRDRAPPGMR